MYTLTRERPTLVTRVRYELTRRWNDDVFQGALATKNYFEGWYVKMVSANEETVFAFIIGVALSEGDAHAFIQSIDRRTLETHYFRFPISAFSFSLDEFVVHIGENTLSREGIRLNLANEDKTFTGDVRFSSFTPWPTSLFSPGVMGWYAFVPNMECYHGIVSMNHALSGTLVEDGKETSFADGMGYIEKDYGRGFPSSWIWMQTNTFDERNVSFFCSIATIPWMGGAFTGFLAGLSYKGRVYAIATHTGWKLTAGEYADDVLTVTFTKGARTLTLETSATKTVRLAAPLKGRMVGDCHEGLDAEVTLRFTEVKQGQTQTIFEGRGRRAGLEIMGDVTALLAIR